MHVDCCICDYLESRDDIFGVFQRGVKSRVGNGQVSRPLHEFDEMERCIQIVLQRTWLEVHLPNNQHALLVTVQPVARSAAMTDSGETGDDRHDTRQEVLTAPPANKRVVLGTLAALTAKPATYWHCR